MTETIQRAARAICVANGEDPDAPDTPYDIRGWRLYKSDVTACIETLLDPSEEAVEAALDAYIDAGSLLTTDAMRAAIRAYIGKELGVGGAAGRAGSD